MKLALALVAAAVPADAAPQVKLHLLSRPFLPVGTTVLFGAEPPVADPPAADPPALYRFSVAPLGEAYSIARDFSPRKGFDWTPIDEGSYLIKVTALDTASGETADAVLGYTVTSRITDGEPVVTPLAHPLVALYSARPCLYGQVRVRFREGWTGDWQATPSKPCTPGRSVNFYVAGMAPETLYQLQDEVVTPLGTARGPLLPFQTGPIDELPVTFEAGSCTGCSEAEGILLHSITFGQDFAFPIPTATDREGRVVWYYDRLTQIWNFGGYLVRPLPGGHMLLIVNDGYVGQVLREIDLAGNTVRETNVPWIRRQLADSGLVDPAVYFVGAIHHDAVRLPSGHTLVVASAEHFIDGIDYLGDVIVDLDEELQVSWVFNSFEHLSMDRLPPLGEWCTSPWVDGCEQLFFGEWAVDSTHTNTIEYVPADSSLLLSMRNQDWIVKVDYRDGSGSGAILWRLGKDGDFTLTSSDPWPWFSHQHDIRADGDLILLYDNGNTRAAADPSAHSRGQVIRIDEAARTATLELNVDLGVYSPAVGSAQRLANGNFHFLSGFLTGATSRSVEVDPRGLSEFETAWTVEAGGTAYRSWRMQSLYLAP